MDGPKIAETEIMIFQLFVISSTFSPQIFDILLLETKTTPPSLKIHTRSFSTCFNYLQGQGTVCDTAILSDKLGRWQFLQKRLKSF